MKSMLSYLGVAAPKPPNFRYLHRAPTVNDYREYVIGELWLVKDTEDIYMLTDKKSSVATWTLLSGGGAGTITQVDGGTNITTVSATGPTVTVNLDDSITLAGDLTLTTGDATITSLAEGVVQSDASGLLFANSGADGQVIVGNTAGAADWYTLTSADGSVIFTPGAGTLDLRSTGGGGGGGVTSNPTDSGTATVSGIGTIDILGGTNINTVASGASIVSVNLDNDVGVSGYLSAGTTVTAGTGLTVSSLGRGVVQSSATGVFSSSEGTDGQLLISSSTGAPAWANLIQGSGITLTSGPNSITIAASGGGTGGLTGMPTDSGTASISVTDEITLLGGSNIGTIATGASEITVNLDNTVSVSGSISAGTSLVAGTTISSTGDISSVSGSVSAGTTVTAGTGITATTGDILASTGDLNLTLGSANIGDSLTVANTVTISSLGAGIVQSSAAGVFSSSNGTAGQVLIGGAADPVWATLTSSDGSVTFTPGAGTLSLQAVGGGGGSFTAVNSGTNITSTAPAGPATTINLNNPILWDYAGQIKVVGFNYLSCGHDGSSVYLGRYSGEAHGYTVGNTAVGGQALYSIQSDYSTAIGNAALRYATTGTNIALGSSAGIDVTTGSGNILLGAVRDLTTGNNNIIIGPQRYLISGSRNVIIDGGPYSGLTTESDNVLINNTGQAGDNNAIRIGESSKTHTYIEGIYGTDVGVGSTVYMNSDGRLGTVTSAALPVSAFRALQTVNKTNMTGDGTTYWLGANAALSEVYDAGGNFYPGSGSGANAVFTAPITGLYNFTLSILLTNLENPPPTPPVVIYIDPLSIVISGGTTYQLINPALVYKGEQTLFYTVYATMTVGQTAQFNCSIVTDAGTKTIGIGATHTWIGGFLIHS